MYIVLYLTRAQASLRNCAFKLNEHGVMEIVRSIEELQRGGKFGQYRKSNELYVC